MPDWDAIVVLGCAVREDGALSPTLRDRVEAGVALWHAGHAPILVMTGGEVGGRPSEAQHMARAARDLGVPPEALVLEERSTSTQENARFTAELIPGARVVVVTQTWHLPRAREHFEPLFPAVHGVGVPGRWRGAFREWVVRGLHRWF